MGGKNCEYKNKKSTKKMCYCFQAVKATFNIFVLFCQISIEYLNNFNIILFWNRYKLIQYEAFF